MYSRKQLKTLSDRISEARKFIQIITGTRQVGKTTLVEQLLAKLKFPGIYYSAESASSSSAWISQQWESARIKLKTSGADCCLLVFDEIQKITNWSETVKKEWDKDSKDKTNIKIILLGSSVLLLEKDLSDSLAGRFELNKLPHWSCNEMKSAFGFNEEQYVWFGGFPGAASLIEDEKRWKNYIQDSIIETTISRDILQLTMIQKPAILKNLFELGCIYSGQILSYTKLLGKIADSGNSTTLAHYQNLLDQVWFLSGLQKFSGSIVTVKGSIPKWCVYNTCFLSVKSNLSFNEAKMSLENWGRYVESSIGAYLINESRVNNWKLNYWRDGNNEVDFILNNNGKVIAVEVKSGKLKIHKGMEIFKNKFNPYKSILVSNDSVNYKDFLNLNLEMLFD